MVYKYYIPSNGSSVSIPITQGNGNYTITVWQRVKDVEYSEAGKLEIDVTLADEFLPFLYASHIVNFDKDCAAVQKARELAGVAEGDAGIIDGVYRYVVDNIRYDHEKVSGLPAGYVSDLDTVMKDAKGICVDYAAVMAAMLRSQGIPTRMVYGNAPGGAYHCWVSVYSNEDGMAGNRPIRVGKWNLLDPTFDANASRGIFRLPRDAGYEAKYIY